MGSEIRPPAAAYLVMAGLLPPSYFLMPPPPAGARLTIVGGDSVRTVWDVSSELAHELRQLLQGRPVRIVSVATYTPPTSPIAPPPGWADP